MPTNNFPGGSSPGSTGNWSNDAGDVYSTFTAPSGRTMANGTDYVVVTEMSLYFTGRNGSRTTKFRIGGSYGDSFTIPTGSSGSTRRTSTMSVGINPGETYRYGAYTNGARWFGRESSGGQTYIDGSAPSAWDGDLSGSYSYAMAPSAPRNVSATPGISTSGAIRINWDEPSSDGDANVTRYNIYRDGSLIDTVSGSTRTYVDTGLTPGTSYSYVLRARNLVTDKYNTQSVSSSSSSATAPGVPSATRNLTATPSTTVIGRIALSWDAPTTTVGGITGYNIYRNSTLIASTTGTGTTYNASGLTPHTSYSFVVRARNAFADSNDLVGAASGTATATAPGAPSEPRNVTGTSPGAGLADLTWTAPINTGGSNTGYTIYDVATDAVLKTTTGTSTTAQVTGLTPGALVGMYIRARNAIADTTGTFGTKSASVYVDIVGLPGAPTGLTVTPAPDVAGRLILTWISPGTSVTGFAIFRYDSSTGVETYIGKSQQAGFIIDNEPVGVLRTFKVKAQNVISNSQGLLGGPSSAPASGSAQGTSNQITGVSLSVTNSTNASFNGTYEISDATNNSFSYIKSGEEIPARTLASTITVTNSSNAALNGTYTITVTGTTTFTYAKTTADQAARALGYIANNVVNATNSSLRGTFTVTAVNSGAKTVSYVNTGADIASVAASGSIKNTTNNVFNGTYTITGVTSTSFTYSRTNADVASADTSGTATNLTAQDINGVYQVLLVPDYERLVVAYTSPNVSLKVWSTLPLPENVIYRTTSAASLSVEYRSGWAG